VIEPATVETGDGARKRSGQFNGARHDVISRGHSGTPSLNRFGQQSLEHSPFITTVFIASSWLPRVEIVWRHASPCWSVRRL